MIESVVSDVYIIQLPYEQFQLLQHVNQDIAMELTWVNTLPPCQ